MSVAIDVETQGEHRYVVRLRDGEDVCESWFNLTPTVLEDMGVGEEDEEGAVRRTAEFLVGHQDVADFPVIVELEDVLATYDDYVAFMGWRGRDC